MERRENPFIDWDLRCTRNATYPRYYVVCTPGKEPKAEGWDLTSSTERDFLEQAFVIDHSIRSTSYTPIEDRFASIVRDLRLVRSHYPIYHHYILNVLANGEVRRKYNDQSGIDGPWYEILAFITWNHSSTLTRSHLPRNVYAPEGEDAERYHETKYPTWDWSKVLDRMHCDILGHHYMEWYYDYCQPNLEKGKERYGKFFQALEMIIDYTTTLVDV